ncbi:MAG: hypothetical protein MZV70_22570 [Desulfobacterales bacterium]|nr:hypothetical protein [Desulfobacterales bacterium]
MTALLLLLAASLSLHEWGVVSYRDTGFSMASSPVDMQEWTLEDKAPVLYFHGDPCRASVRVTSAGGTMTAVLPEPAMGGTGSDFVLWNDLEISDEGTENPWPFDPAWEWGWLWSDVQALWIGSGFFRDRYLFYECALPQPGILPYVVEGGNPSLRVEYSGVPCVLLRNHDGATQYAVTVLLALARREGHNWEPLDGPDQIREIVSSWSEGVLEPDEFNALWETWRQTFIDAPLQGPHVIYRIPGRVLDDFAGIEATTDRGDTVEIHRFQLAFVPASVQ